MFLVRTKPSEPLAESRSIGAISRTSSMPARAPMSILAFTFSGRFVNAMSRPMLLTDAMAMM